MEQGNGSREWIFAFEGRYPDHVLQRSDTSPQRLLADSQEQATAIERELQNQLSQALRSDVFVRIEFREGSFEWFGEINAALGVVANVGGTIALLQLIGNVISRVLRRFLPSRLPHPHTRVVIIYAPQVQARTVTPVASKRNWQPIDLLVLSCISLNTVALVVLCILAARLLI